MGDPYRKRVEIGPHVLYLGDCLEIAPTLTADAVVSDPPYGMGWDTDTTRFSGGSFPEDRGLRIRPAAPVHGDTEPFDPTPWLAYDRVVLWGANHYGARLPVGTTLVWVKRNDAAFGTFLSDAEIAWMSGGVGVYCFRKLFNGSNRDEAGVGESHPCAKPVDLMAWCIERCGAPKGATVLDPFMGHGPTGVACAKLGRRFIGIEIHEPYFDIACRRIADAVNGGVQPELFG